MSDSSRRRFLALSAATLGSLAVPRSLFAGSDTITMPFANGQRHLRAYPEKRPLIVVTSRPPQLETPFEVFNESLLTPNDAFFVRYHNAGIPTRIDGDKHVITIGGNALQNPFSLSMKALRTEFKTLEYVAVNQCSGNGRAFFSPRVTGGQLGNGAMGNARWRGVSLKDVLARAGVKDSAKQVTFNGLDTAILGGGDFVKALEIDHALDGEVMLAYQMNGADIPMLNGYPVKLIVPGYYGTYWVKHLSEINVIDSVFDGFWMKTAYRVADSAQKTRPISRMNVRSFITSLKDGDRVTKGTSTIVKGIAFDGGEGISEVAYSSNGGQDWKKAELLDDLGRYSFRGFRFAFTPREGEQVLCVRAFNRSGQSQPIEPLSQPSGYMRNVVERLRVVAAMLIVSLSLGAEAKIKSITLPEDGIELKASALPGYEKALASCRLCHSAEYMVYQPPTATRTYWEAMVLRMKNIFNAPVADEDKADIVDYLVKTYGAEQPVSSAAPSGR